MTTREELDSFHRYAAERLADPACAADLDELFMQWQDSQSSEEIDAAIRRGLADVESGRYQPAEFAMEEIRQKFGFVKE